MKASNIPHGFIAVTSREGVTALVNVDFIVSIRKAQQCPGDTIIKSYEDSTLSVVESLETLCDLINKATGVQ